MFKITLIAVSGLLLAPLTGVAAGEPSKPNIIYILADDLGYGDVSILNPTKGKIHTPSLDRLAKEGIIFTDGHASSSVCTPSRYGILTGRYCWRTMDHGVLGGNSKPIIPPTRMTVASFLKSQGYETACIGKWHLGMDMPLTGDKKRSSLIDFTKPITGGPNAVGFDYYYGVAASLDMLPYVYIENDRFTAVPTKTTEAHGGLAMHRAGPIADDFEFEQILPHLTDKAVTYINTHAKQDKPFFLYFPMTGPHTPIVPTAEFKGKTPLGDYGDFCVEVDAMVGKVLAAVDQAGITQNTWIIFTSDNGCSRAAKFKELEALGHYPSAQFRGMKADVYEGGHRVPFLMRWPAKIVPGSISDAPICNTDLLATCAELRGQQLPENAGEDSVSMLPVMFGSGPIQRDTVVHQSIHGYFAIRQGNWKLELCPGSGGWSSPTPGSKEEKGLPPTQLYDLSTDIAEQHNVVAEHPEIVQRMTALLQKYVDSGRSTPGKPQKNDIPVEIHRKDAESGKGEG